MKLVTMLDTTRNTRYTQILLSVSWHKDLIWQPILGGKELSWKELNGRKSESKLILHEEQTEKELEPILEKLDLGSRNLTLFCRFCGPRKEEILLL